MVQASASTWRTIRPPVLHTMAAPATIATPRAWSDQDTRRIPLTKACQHKDDAASGKTGHRMRGMRQHWLIGRIFCAERAATSAESAPASAFGARLRQQPAAEGAEGGVAAR